MHGRRNGQNDFVSSSVTCYFQTTVEMISDPGLLSAEQSQYNRDCLSAVSKLGHLWKYERACEPPASVPVLVIAVLWPVACVNQLEQTRLCSGQLCS